MSINWNLVDFFNSSEFDDPKYPGSGDRIDGSLLILLVRLRKTVDCPVIIHNSVGGAIDVDGSHGHSENSYHLLKNGAKAIDCHFNTDMNIREQVYYAITSGFSGIGMYYNWFWNNRPLSLGFHFDIRPKNRTQLWNCFEKGKYIYLLK